MGKFCQSCGMPLKKDPQGGGTEVDGARSTTYCSYCYDKGTFLHPDATLREFQAECVKAMQRDGLPKPLAWLFTRGMPQLGRWKT